MGHPSIDLISLRIVTNVRYMIYIYTPEDSAHHPGRYRSVDEVPPSQGPRCSATLGIDGDGPDRSLWWKPLGIEGKPQEQ